MSTKTHDEIVVSSHESVHGSLASYTVGFVLSIVLTIAAYLAVTNNLVKGWSLVIVIICLAITQFFVQLVFFLHLGKGSKPGWNIMMLGFMMMVVCILVIGSLWIMYNLNYRMMRSPKEVNAYMKSQSGL